MQNVKSLLQKEVAFPTAHQLLGNTELISHKPQDNAGTMSKNLKEIVSRSHEVLARARTVFPLTLFPDDVIVDRTKVTIMKRDFLWSENLISIRIEDVLNVSAGMGPFFASLNLASRVMNSTDHFQINFLWKKDAIHLKHLIQGYVIALHNNIEISHLGKEELIDTLCELGHDSKA